MSQHEESERTQRQTTRKRWPWVFGIIVLVVAVVAVVAVVGTGRSSGTASSAATTSTTTPGEVFTSTSPGESAPARKDASGATSSQAPKTGKGGSGPTSTSTTPATSGPAESGGTASGNPATPSAGGTPRELPAAKPGAVVSARPGLDFAISRVESVTGEVALPGEVSGPAVRLTITVINRGESDVALDSFSVNAYVGQARVPAGSITEPGGSPFAGTLKPRSRASGVYLFTIPADQRDLVRVTVDYQVQEPQVVFEGSLAR